MPQIKANLMGTGTPAEQAKSISGRVVTGLTSSGSSSQANSLAISAEINVVTTTGANTGVRLPANLSAGDSMLVVNNGASTLFIYPPVGGIINGGSADAKVDVATLKGALCTCINGLDFSVVVGA
jgi:hypothetical protein